MKDPLRKRFPREVRHEFGKYFMILVLLVTTIGFVSGFLVADGSMITAYKDSFETYNIENGNFLTSEELSAEQKEEIEKQGIRLYDNFYVERELDNGSTIRIFKNREEVNRVCLMKGEMPKQAGEIVLDRMFADNNGFHVGDTIRSGDDAWQVTGVVALSDYSALFSDNNDMMFDSILFGVAVVDGDGFEELGSVHRFWSYSWKYDNEPKDDIEEKEASDDLLKEIGKIAPLEAFVPRYINQSIQFTGDDMGNDRAMMMVLLYIVIVILAFVFGITTLNTIAKESAVIGTLRASGYTRGELVRHYMAVPVTVTFVGAVIGNVLGYTVFKNVCAWMYYQSYSLTTYKTLWNVKAFVLTTVIPVVLMFVINFVILTSRLRLSPLKFIRRDLKKNSKKKAVRLNKKWNFFLRFRLRILFQNSHNYVMLFVGVVFANLLLMFGMLFPALLGHYQDDIVNHMFAEYQYMLKAPVVTDYDDAEKFAASSLKTLAEDGREEQIAIYGLETDSRYVRLDFSDGGVYVSDGYAEKFRLKKGDSFTLQERYGTRQYTFKVAGTYTYPAALCVFMPLEDYRDMFDKEADYFGGYLSDKELTDLDENVVAGVVDKEDLTKVTRQLDRSMGNLMYLVDGFAMLIFVVVIYLLSKIIIEKNAPSISMAKILGYQNGEIGRLYVLSTSMVVLFSILVSLPIETIIMQRLLFYYIMNSMNGWLTFYIDPKIYVEMAALGIITYAFVAVLEFARIRRIPMGEALKNGE